MCQKLFLSYSQIIYFFTLKSAINCSLNKQLSNYF